MRASVLTLLALVSTTALAYPVGHVSPVTLDSRWDLTARAVFFISVGLFGIIFATCFILVFFRIKNYCFPVDYNLFMFVMGIVDFISICSSYLPAFFMLVTHTDNLKVCQILHVWLQILTMTYHILAAFSAYYEICQLRLVKPLGEIESTRNVIYFLLIHIGSGTAAIIYGVYSENQYNVCKGTPGLNFHYQFTFFSIFYLGPFVVAMLCASNKVYLRNMHHRAMANNRSHRMVDALTNSVLNLSAYLLHVGCWLPWFVSTWAFPDATVWNYWFLWIGLTRPVLTSFLYGVAGHMYRSMYWEVLTCTKCPTHSIFVV